MLKYLRLILLAVVCSLLVGCGQQQAQQTQAPAPVKKKLTIANAPGNYPFQMMDKNGNLIGYNIDLTKQLGEYLGVDIEFQAYSGIGDMIPAIQAKKVDLIISGVTVTEKRKEVVDFSDPYFESYHSILVNNKYKDLKSWQELDKPGIDIAVSIGSMADELATKMFKNATIKRFDTFALAGQAVLNGQAAAIVRDDTWLNVFHIYNSDKTYILEPKIGDNSMLAIVAAKGNKELLDKVNAFLKQYKESGAEAKNYEKWFKNDSWKDLVPPKE